MGGSEDGISGSFLFSGLGSGEACYEGSTSVDFLFALGMMIWFELVGGILEDAFTNLRFFLNSVLISSEVIYMVFFPTRRGVGIGMAKIGFTIIGGSVYWMD